jgi:aryl-alcohol dehydrogenase-like predicted oxidoreductase
MANLATLQSEGLFGCVGLSEVTAATLRKAHAIHPVALVENELSLFNLEEEALDVVKACDELGIVYTAYSPLGRGMLVQRYKTFEELPPDDNRRKFPRFQGENFAKVRRTSHLLASSAPLRGMYLPHPVLALLTSRTSSSATRCERSPIRRA